MREFHRLDHKAARHLAKHNLRQISVRLTRHRDRRHTRTYGLDHKEYFSDIDPCYGLRTAESDKDCPRVDIAQLSNRRIHGSDKDRLIAASCKPIGKFQPKV